MHPFAYFEAFMRLKQQMLKLSKTFWEFYTYSFVHQKYIFVPNNDQGTQWAPTEATLRTPMFPECCLENSQALGSKHFLPLFWMVNRQRMFLTDRKYPKLKTCKILMVSGCRYLSPIFFKDRFSKFDVKLSLNWATNLCSLVKRI